MDVRYLLLTYNYALLMAVFIGDNHGAVSPSGKVGSHLGYNLSKTWPGLSLLLPAVQHHGIPGQILMQV